MRPSSRFLAALSKGSPQYLTAHAPTGLTGVLTHPHPRASLLYIYSSTLSKLAQLPKESLYRRSTEALTRHRLGIVEATLPAGFSEWQRKIIDQVLPEIENGKIKPTETLKQLEVLGKPYLYQSHVGSLMDERDLEWDGERNAARGEGARSEEFRQQQAKSFGDGGRMVEVERSLEIENEPPLTRDQISAIEEKIGAGLIEEVIMVAKKEHELVDVMLENKVWEELEEKPVKGQWEYFERDTHVMSTQSP